MEKEIINIVSSISLLDTIIVLGSYAIVKPFLNLYVKPVIEKVWRRVLGKPAFDDVIEDTVEEQNDEQAEEILGKHRDIAFYTNEKLKDDLIKYLDTKFKSIHKENKALKKRLQQLESKLG